MATLKKIREGGYMPPTEQKKQESNTGPKLVYTPGTEKREVTYTPSKSTSNSLLQKATGNGYTSTASFRPGSRQSVPQGIQAMQSLLSIGTQSLRETTDPTPYQREDGSIGFENQTYNRYVERKKQEAKENRTTSEKVADAIKSAGKGIVGFIDAATDIPTVKNAALSGMAQFNNQVAQTANVIPSAIASAIGVENKFPTQNLADYTQRVSEQFAEETHKAASQYGKGGEVAANLLSTSVSAAPNAILALASGGGSAITQLAPKAAWISGAISNGLKTVLSNPLTKSSFLQTVGTEYQNALDSGADAGEALVAAIGSSLVQSAVESGGGIETLPNNLRTGDTNKWLAILKSGAEEAIEEPAQNIVSGAIQKGVYDSSRPFFSTTDDTAVINPAREAETAAMAFGSGLLLGGAQNAVLNAVQGRRAALMPQQQQTDVQQSDAARAILEATGMRQTPTQAQSQTDPVQQTTVGSQNVTVNQPSNPVTIDQIFDLSNGNRITTQDLNNIANRLGMDNAVSSVMDAMNRGEVAMDAAGSLYRSNQENHIDNRDSSTVGNRSLNAFQFDNPQLHGYYVEAARLMLDDLNATQRGERFYQPGSSGNDVEMEGRWTGVKRNTSPEISTALDDYNLSYSDLEKALEAIIQNHGQENYAAAKKVELILDQILTDGHTSLLNGIYTPPNNDYIRAKGEISGGTSLEELNSFENFINQPLNSMMLENGEITEDELRNIWQQQNAETESVGAAESGFDPFSRLQEQSTEYHPINEQAAQAAQERFGRAPIEVPTENQYGRRISKTASTFLNSPNTDNTTARAIEQRVAENGFSYIPLTDETVFQTARNRIQNDGYESALATFYQRAGNGRSAKENNALGITLYNEAAAAGDAETALDILDSLQSTVRDNARALQVMNAINKLTPAGKLYMINKTVQNMNDAAVDGRNQNQVNRTAKNIGNDVTKSVMGSNIPVQEWWMESADQLSAAVDRTANQTTTGQKTTMQEILSDLKRFAYQSASQKVQRTGNTKTDLQRVTDYLNNQAFYNDVWQDAQQLLEEKYAGNESAIEQYRNWLNSSIEDSINKRLKGKAGKGNLDQLRAAIETGGFRNSALREGLNAYLFGDAPFQVNPQLAEAYLQAETDEQRNDILDRIKQDIADQIPSTFMDKFTAIRYLNMLGNLKTQGRNLAGNAIMAGVRTLKNTIATGLEIAVDNVSKAAGKGGIQRTKSFTSDPALYKAALADSKNVDDQLLGAGKYDDHSAANRDINSKRTIFKNSGTWGTTENSSAIARAARKTTDLGWRALESYRKATSWAMDKGDVIFSKTAYADSLAGYLNANGVTAQQLIDGTVNQDILDKARAYAITEAQKATFRDNNAFSDAVSGIGFKNANTLTKKSINAVVEGTLPFKKTPANVLVRTVEYSPISIVRSAVDTARLAAGNENITASRIIDELASGLTGTGLLALGVALFNNGVLRGGDNDDEDQAYFDKLQGHQAYSLEIDGNSYTIDWMSPAAVPLFVGAELAKYGAENGISVDDLYKVASQMTNPIIQMSMLQGINDAFTSISYSDDGFIQFVLNAGLNYITQGLTSTIGGQLERTLEENRMTTYTDAESASGRSLQREIGSATAKIPGIDYNQMEYINEWGQPESNGSVTQRILENFLSPGYYSNVETTDRDRYIQEVYDATGNKSVLPNRITDRTITVNGTDYEIPADLQQQRQITYGTTRDQILQEAIDSGVMESMSIEEREQFMVNARDLASEIAKQELLTALGVEYTPSKALQTVQSGVDATEYSAFDAIYKAIDKSDTGNEYPPSVEAIMAITQAGITDNDTAAALWESKNSTTNAEKNPYSGTMQEYGLDAEDISGIVMEQNRIDDMDLKSGEKAAELSKYLDSIGVTGDAYNAAMELYGFRTSFHATPKPYDYKTMNKTQQTNYDDWGKDFGWTETAFIDAYNAASVAKDTKEYKDTRSEARKDRIMKEALVAAGFTNEEASRFVRKFKW